MNDIYRTATFRLTIWYVLMVMSVSLVFSILVYLVARNELSLGLHNQSARIYQTYPVFTNDPFFIHDNDVDLGAQHLLLNLLYLNLAVFVGATLGSYWLARRTLRPIAEANEGQKRFVADASHELRTPLTALKMETEVALIDDAASKADLRAALSSNLEEVNTLDSLLTSLLRLSRLESGGDITLRDTDLTSVVGEALTRVDAQARAKNIQLEAKRQVRTTVQADHDSLVQLLVILLDNAIKYSPPKSSVTVTAKATDDHIVVSIHDHGVGIAPDALAHVFDRFYRADNARQGHQGYGLGLSIAKHIADAHNATLTLTSAPGKGTKAELLLPASRPSA